MIVSLNEIETLATKAARGAGFAWGMAEEIGFAARWLAARDLDGIGALDALLATPAACRRSDACPINVGTRLADGAVRELPWASPDLFSPLLLLPFAACFAENRQAVLEVTLGDALAEIMPNVDDGQVVMSGEASALRSAVRIAPTSDTSLHEMMRGSNLALRTASGPPVSNPAPEYTPSESWPSRRVYTPRSGERMVDASRWARLGALELRTYVPASAQSRQTGAGGRLGDND